MANEKYYINAIAIWQHMLHIPPTKYSSPNRSKKQKNKSHTNEPTFRKMEVWGKSGQENGPKPEENKTERATGLGRRRRGDIEQWDQTGKALRFQTGWGDIRNPPASLRGETAHNSVRMSTIQKLLPTFPYNRNAYVFQSSNQEKLGS